MQGSVMWFWYFFGLKMHCLQFWGAGLCSTGCACWSSAHMGGIGDAQRLALVPKFGNQDGCCNSFVHEIKSILLLLAQVLYFHRLHCRNPALHTLITGDSGEHSHCTTALRKHLTRLLAAYRLLAGSSTLQANTESGYLEPGGHLKLQTRQLLLLQMLCAKLSSFRRKTFWLPYNTGSALPALPHRY